jgi:hypothetical protein
MNSRDKGNLPDYGLPLNEVTSAPLTAIKVVHTIVWAIFAACIVAIPVASWRDEQRVAAWLAAIVAIEVAVLVLNGCSCPLTSIAARYTDDRRENFDIYLPEWLAKHNKFIFGALYVVGAVFALVRWTRAANPSHGSAGTAFSRWRHECSWFGSSITPAKAHSVRHCSMPC